MTTMSEAFDTAKTLLDDLSKGHLIPDPSHRGHHDVKEILDQKGMFYYLLYILNLIFI